MALANWISAFATLVGLIVATCWGTGLVSGVGGGVGLCSTEDTEGVNSIVLVSVRTFLPSTSVIVGVAVVVVGVNSTLP